jgi:hypothetical protein
MRCEFATLFDRRYLTRGIALYRSLTAHCPDFRLRVFCLDGETLAALRKLALPGVVAISLEELERHDPALVAVKGTRSRTEYYWTATPAICMFALEREPDLDHVVHLDADLEFYADPALLLDELEAGSVLLIPHRPAPEFGDFPGNPRPLGHFNVSVEVFRRDDQGLAALRWWRERCLEWCYDRVEPARYGDQKYLDEMPLRFSGVRECVHRGAGLAPWNVAAHDLAWRDGRLCVDGETPAIFHHFQGLEVHPATRAGLLYARASRAYRLTRGPVPLVWTAGWRLTESELQVLWDPYVARLSVTAADVRDIVGAAAEPPPLRPRRAAFHELRRRLPVGARNAYRRLRRAPALLGGRLP